MRYGGGWHGPYGPRYGYRGYGYRPYGYVGYHPYYGGYYGYPFWGALGAMFGVLVAPRPVYVYAVPPPPPAAPPVQQCPDGSTLPLGSVCAAPPPAPLPAPAPAPAPAPTPRPAPERG